jgi:hypothetical protein
MRWIEGDHISGPPVDEHRDDALQRYLSHPGVGNERFCQAGILGLVGRLDGKKARGDVDQSAPWDDHEVGSHAGKGCRQPRPQGQPATKLAKPIPTLIITAIPRNIARARRRPTFCAASRRKSQRPCRRVAILRCGRPYPAKG